MAAKGRFLEAVWPENANGFALFRHITAEEAPALDALAASTLYHGMVYTLRVDVIGRRATEADERALLDAALRFVRMNRAVAEPVELLVLPEGARVSASPAVPTQSANEINLTLDSVPDTLPTTLLTLSGTTEARASVRCAVNGQDRGRVYADGNGRFSFRLKDLVGDAQNTVELTATKSQRTAALSLAVTVDWQTTPLALSLTEGEAEGEKFLLSGLTLPGASAQVLRKGRAVALKVRDDGSFTCRVTLNEAGDTLLAIRVQADGYRAAELPVRLHCAVDDEKALRRLEKNVAEIRYTRLLQSPERYAERLLRLEGVVEALGQADGFPCYLLRTGAGDGYLCQCDDLFDVALGMPVRLLATVTGQTEAFVTPWAAGSFPLTLETYRYAQKE